MSAAADARARLPLAPSMNRHRRKTSIYDDDGDAAMFIGSHTIAGCRQLWAVSSSSKTHGPWLSTHGPWLSTHGLWLSTHGPWLTTHGPWLQDTWSVAPKHIVRDCRTHFTWLQTTWSLTIGPDQFVIHHTQNTAANHRRQPPSPTAHAKTEVVAFTLGWKAFLKT